MTYQIKRIVSSGFGTFGVLLHGDYPLCVTCEDPWNENQRMISCIPPGDYHCVPYSSPKFPNVWELKNVPNRDKILIHGGNSINDTHGCILVGRGFSHIGKLPSITQSQDTLSILRDVLPSEFDLTIKECL